MDSSIFIYLSAGGILFLMAVIVMLNIRHRKSIREKELSIVRRLREKDLLEDELAHINIEKNIMEKMLKSKFEHFILISSPREKDSAETAPKPMMDDTNVNLQDGN